MQRTILILTGLLVVVGILVFLLQRSQQSDTFTSTTDYEKARTDETMPSDAPPLPKCAQNIELASKDTKVSAITFTCTNVEERKAFVAQIQNGFLWNVFVLDANRIRLERAGE